MVARAGDSEPVTRRLAEVLASTQIGDLPPLVLESAHRAVIDWLGSAVAGAVEHPARVSQQVVAGFGQSGESTVFAAGRASAAGAALANGVAAHILELDDIHKGSTVHAAAPVISAAFSIAERQHADGARFLMAVTVGYEAALRIGEAVNPSHYRYWHPTGTAATFGAAAAAGSLIALSPRQMQDALGSAGTQAAGLWEFNADGAMSKHLHPGKAAFNGILSADLAQLGFTGAARILEGPRGFFEAMSSSHDASRITDGLGQHWKITENCYKVHACCGHTHTAIDIALSMRGDRQWTGHDAAAHVVAVDIETYGPGYEIVQERDPRTPYQAKFSIAYCVAVALLEGRVGLEQFSADRFDDNGLRDPAIRSLLQRTRVTVADDLTARYPAAWPARVRLTLGAGDILQGASDYPRGNPEYPISTSALEDKMVGLIEPRFGASVAEALLIEVRRIGSCPDVATALRDIVPTSAGASA
jgi:2-methylcitrate dehydratase PrpD